MRDSNSNFAFDGAFKFKLWVWPLCSNSNFGFESGAQIQSLGLSASSNPKFEFERAVKLKLWVWLVRVNPKFGFGKLKV